MCLCFHSVRLYLKKRSLCVCSQTPLATFHEGKHNIAHMDMDPSRGLMVTCGSDRIVKVNNRALIPDDSCVCWFCLEQRAFEPTLKLKLKLNPSFRNVDVVMRNQEFTQVRMK